MNKSTLLFISVIIVIITVTSLSVTYWVSSPTIYKGKTLDDFNKIVQATGAIPADNAYYQGEGKTITVYGRIIEVLSRDLAPPRHERFIITVKHVKNLTVIYNVDYLSRGWLNVKVGDLVVFTGEMIDSQRIHKIAENGGFLVLFRESTGEMIEVGYVGFYDNMKIAVISVIDLALVLLYILLKKKFL